jgi:hypothetical protein
VVGPEGLELLLWRRTQDEVRHSVAKDQEENYLEFEESPLSWVKKESDRGWYFERSTRVWVVSHPGWPLFGSVTCSLSHTQALPYLPSLLQLFSSLSPNAGDTHSVRNLSTCSGARPMNHRGLSSPSNSSLIGSKYTSFRTRSIKSFSNPNCFT